VALTTAKDDSADRHCLLNPPVQTAGLIHRNHRAYEGVFVFRIANRQGFHLGHEALAEFRVQGFVHQNALHADATLARLVEGAECDALHCIGQIRARVNNARRVAAQFQHHFLFARASLKSPAHNRRTGEAQEFQAIVGGEQIGAIAVAWQDRERALWQISLC
jgi:hypothetical protein